MRPNFEWCETHGREAEFASGATYAGVSRGSRQEVFIGVDLDGAAATL